mgnify:CR=1 FL=1
MPHNILIVDDEADIRGLISDTLKDEGYIARSAKNSAEAFAAIAETVPSAIILDIWLKESELDGLGILENVKSRYPGVPVIMISGHGNIETAINSIKLGAYDFIEKPFKEEKLVLLLKRAIEAAELKSENEILRAKAGVDHDLIGRSPCMTQLQQAIDKVAPTGSRVFITGASGSGKEVVARLIHKKSKRANTGAFVVLGGAGLSEDRVDIELFGTEEESVSGPARKIGTFERADKGTLFIDEITDMPLATQAKLLRVIQDGYFRRIGGNKQINVDVRVIAASSKNVTQMIESGKFREDLYYRLNVVPINVPPLCERRDDIPALSKFFLKQFADNTGMPIRDIASEAIATLQAYNWPGNVRQLKNVIEWLLIMTPTDDTNKPITSEMLPQEIFSSTPVAMNPELNRDIMAMPLREAREMFERQYLEAQINRFGGNISRTSEFVEMERSALHRKLKSLKVANKEKA